jgi:hypothetical protein
MPFRRGWFPARFQASIECVSVLSAGTSSKTGPTLVVSRSRGGLTDFFGADTGPNSAWFSSAERGQAEINAQTATMDTNIPVGIFDIIVPSFPFSICE